MTEKIKDPSRTENDSAKITVSKNGPYIVAGGVPIITSEICNDDEGNPPDYESPDGILVTPLCNSTTV